MLSGFDKRMELEVQEDFDYGILLGYDISQVAQGRAWPRKGAVNQQEFIGEVRTRSQAAAERAELERQVELRGVKYNDDRKLGGEGLEDAQLGLEEVDSESSDVTDGKQEAEGEVEEEMEVKNAWLKELNHGIYMEEFQRQKPKQKLSRSPKREARRKFNSVEDNPDPLNHGEEGLRRAQVQDSSLKRAWENLHCGDLRYALKDGILYRRTERS